MQSLLVNMHELSHVSGPNPLCVYPFSTYCARSQKLCHTSGPLAYLRCSAITSAFYRFIEQGAAGETDGDMEAGVGQWLSNTTNVTRNDRQAIPYKGRDSTCKVLVLKKTVLLLRKLIITQNRRCARFWWAGSVHFNQSQGMFLKDDGYYLSYVSLYFKVFSCYRSLYINIL
jgi:hypothetical protein